MCLVGGSRRLTLMSADAADKPGVIAPPPLIYLAAIVLGAALEQPWVEAANEKARRNAVGLFQCADCREPRTIASVADS